MNIDILFYSYEPGLGGSGGVRKVLSLAEAMRKLGHTVRVFLPSFLAICEPGVVSYRVPEKSLFRPWIAYWRMACIARRSAKESRPDILYFRGGVSVLPALLARRLGTRFFYEINGDIFGEKGWSMGILRALVGIAADWVNCRLAQRIIVLTPGLAEMARRRYGVSPEKVRVVPSGADIERIRPMDAAPCRKELGLPLEGPVLLFLGVLYWHQGVQTLLESAPEILRHFKGTRFLIVGDGPAREMLETKARSMGLGDSVRFEGNIPYDRIPLYLGAADCCVAPFTAQRGETSPLKLFDYMAAGKPSVAGNIPSVAPIIESSGAIVAVPPENPEQLAKEVVSLMQDAARRQRMGAAGRRYVAEHHDWKNLARLMLQDAV